LSNWQQPIYLIGKFNQSEIDEINQALNISQNSSSTSNQNFQKVGSRKATVINPNSKNNSNFGPIAVVIGVLEVAGVSVYCTVKSKKLKLKKISRQKEVFDLINQTIELVKLVNKKLRSVRTPWLNIYYKVKEKY